MSVFDFLFGSKKSTTSTSNSSSNTNQTANPVPLDTFSGPIDWVGNKLTDLSKLNPNDLVAGLTPSQQAAITGVNNLAGDQYYDNAMRDAMHLNNQGGGEAANNLKAIDFDAIGKKLNFGSFDAPSFAGPQAISGPQIANDYRVGDTSTRDVNSRDITSRMNPFINSVMQPALQAFDLNSAVQDAKARATNAGQRAFGDLSSRGQIMRDYTNSLARDQVAGNYLNSGYTQAAGLSETDKARQLSSAQGNQSTAAQMQGLNYNANALTGQLGLKAQEDTAANYLDTAKANQQAALTTNQLNFNNNQLTSANTLGLLDRNTQNQKDIASLYMNIGKNQAALAGDQTAGDLSKLQAQMGAGQAEYDIEQRKLQAPFTQAQNIASIAFGSPMGQEASGSTTATATGTGTTTATPSLFDTVSGVVKAGVGAGIFARGGHVPALSGMAHRMDPEMRLMSMPGMRRHGMEMPALAAGGSPSAYYRRYNNQHYADGGYVDDGDDDFSMSGGPQMASADDMAQFMGQDPAQRRGAALDPNAPALQRDFGDGMATEFIPQRPEPQQVPSDMGDSSPLTQASRTTGTPPSAALPPPGASPQPPTTAPLKAALATVTQKRSFHDRLKDFLDNPEVIEGFSMFSPAWKSLRDERMQVGALQYKATIDQMMESQKEAAAERLERLKGGYDLSKARLEHPYLSNLSGMMGSFGVDKDSAPGLFAGDSEEVQSRNALIIGQALQHQGKPIPPALQQQIDMAHAKFASPRIVTTPDGQTILYPGEDLSAFPGPSHGSPALGGGMGGGQGGGKAAPALGPQRGGASAGWAGPGSVISTKPMDPGAAASMADMDKAGDDVKEAVDILFEGDLDKGPYHRFDAAIGNYAPGFIPSKGKEAISAAERAFEALQTARRVAGGGKEGISQRKERYVPSPFDSDSEARTKLRRLSGFFAETKQLMGNARSGEVGGASAPALTPSKRQIFRNPKTGKRGYVENGKWHLLGQ